MAKLMGERPFSSIVEAFVTARVSGPVARAAVDAFLSSKDRETASEIRKADEIDYLLLCETLLFLKQRNIKIENTDYRIQELIHLTEDGGMKIIADKFTNEFVDLITLENLSTKKRDEAKYKLFSHTIPIACMLGLGGNLIKLINKIGIEPVDEKLFHQARSLVLELISDCPTSPLYVAA